MKLVPNSTDFLSNFFTKPIVNLFFAILITLSSFLVHFESIWIIFLHFLIISSIFALFNSIQSKIIKNSFFKQQELNEKLIQSQKLASLGELSSGIAHEINTPLAIIYQECEIISLSMQSISIESVPSQNTAYISFLNETTESVAEIKKQIERCKEITHGMLNLSRKHTPIIQSFDLNELIDDMSKWIELEADKNIVHIIKNYDLDLPKIQSDPPLLRQVVLNLLNNAFQAVERDGEITITTGIHDSNNIFFSIKDSGCGIPETHLSKIFDPFFTTKAPGKGTGLGLSICFSIIQKLGGSISVSSIPQKYTSFTVTLPICISS